MAAITRWILMWLCSVAAVGSAQRYKPTWSSLDKRPLPGWYDQAKFGIFVHWGVFSVPSFAPDLAEWFWRRWRNGVQPYVDFMTRNYREGFTYADFAESFTAELYDPEQWARVFESSGAKYVVLTAKHHEGFANWPSKVSFNWNAWDVGPRRDLVGDLASAIRSKTSLRFGLYHSLFEWFNQLYIVDADNDFSTQNFVKDKVTPELHELVSRYRPEVLWSDGDRGPHSYWNSTAFLAWLYNDSPVKDTVVTNDRWGDGVICNHGDFYTCADNFNPGQLQLHKWENCMTIDRTSWGFRRNAFLDDYLSIEELVEELVVTVSCGGNLLMNVGPTHDGRIIPIYEERLRQMGTWLAVNGEAIYGSRPWTYQNDTGTTGVWYTSKKDGGDTVVYATLLQWPDSDVITLWAPEPTEYTRVSMLGYPYYLTWTTTSRPNGIVIDIPVIPFNQMPCQWGWVLKLEYLARRPIRKTRKQPSPLQQVQLG